MSLLNVDAERINSLLGALEGQDQETVLAALLYLAANDEEAAQISDESDTRLSDVELLGVTVNVFARLVEQGVDPATLLNV